MPLETLKTQPLQKPQSIRSRVDYGARKRPGLVAFIVCKEKGLMYIYTYKFDVILSGAGKVLSTWEVVAETDVTSHPTSCS